MITDILKEIFIPFITAAAKEIAKLLTKKIKIVLKKKTLKTVIIASALFAAAAAMVIILWKLPVKSPSEEKPPAEAPRFSNAKNTYVEEREPDYTEEAEFTVKYMKNGIEEERNVKAGSEITISGGDGLSRWRYVFNGWKSNAEEYYKAGNSLIVREDIIFYPQWKPISGFAETKQIPLGETNSFFSGDIDIHIDRISTENIAPNGEKPVYSYVLDGWISASGKREQLTGFKPGSTHTFSETFDITIKDIQRDTVAVAVTKYAP